MMENYKGFLYSTDKGLMIFPWMLANNVGITMCNRHKWIKNGEFEQCGIHPGCHKQAALGEGWNPTQKDGSDLGTYLLALPHRTRRNDDILDITRHKWNHGILTLYIYWVYHFSDNMIYLTSRKYGIYWVL